MTAGPATVATLGLAGLLAVAGCSTSSPSAGGSAAGGTTQQGSPTTTTAPVDTIVHTVTIKGKNVTPPPGNLDVPLGKTLRLIVTSDRDDELHVHGFEVEKELKAGIPTTLDLKATNPGVYEIETHHPPLTLLHVVVR